MKHSTKMWCICFPVLSIALVLLPGCANIRIVDRTTETALPPADFDAAANADEHDMAVLAIDFDPPLEYEQIMLSKKGITLLVAVENSGCSNESNVTVQAALSTDDGKTVVLEDEKLIPDIAPGEITIVRFKSLGDIPYRKAYQLEVRVLPVTGEAHAVNNQKSYDLYVTQPE
ncbi:MAG: hypothetical protein SVX38_00305 [Chloroflexota bacterium]|nr:hypothetical protein [Chloroflexota bacterium]